MASLTRSLRLSSPRRRTAASIRFNSSDPILVATVTSVIRRTILVYHGKPIFQSSGLPDDGQSAGSQIGAWSSGRESNYRFKPLSSLGVVWCCYEMDLSAPAL